MEQILYMDIEERYVPALKYLIYDLDERGYLTEEPEKISCTLKTDLETVKEAVKILHSMEPLGGRSKKSSGMSSSSASRETGYTAGRRNHWKIFKRTGEKSAVPDRGTDRKESARGQGGKRKDQRAESQTFQLFSHRQI